MDPIRADIGAESGTGLVDTEERAELAAGLRRFLSERSPLPEVRRWMETPTGYDPALWKQMAGELGLPGVAVPEAFGGQGFSGLELALVMRELGRALACAPFLSSVVLAGGAVECAGTEEQRRELLGAIASGETFALALHEGAGPPGAAACTAVPREGAFRLCGRKDHVVDGHSASRLVVAAREPGTSGAEGVGLFLVEGDAAGLSRTPVETLDRTRRLARLALDDVRAVPLGEPGRGALALEATLERAAVALANEMLGGMRAVIDMAVAYAKTRRQFARPIGSFQAVKHKCADLWIDYEAACSAVDAATRAAAVGDPELPLLASLALAWVSEAYFHAAAENIQIHGGIGFTWEHDAHLYLRRAKASQMLLGEPAWHRERVAQRMGL